MKSLQRRDLCAAGLLAATLPSWAQGRPQEGRHYQRLRTPQPVTNPKGEVLEFFWYGCPGCYALEPALQQWLARKPAQVSFRRSHVVIREMSKAHQRIFFTLEALGLGESLHARMFTALQVERQELQELPQIQAYLARFNVDPAKFAALYQSFGVQARCQQANTLLKNYEGTGVPLLGVNGRYITSPSMAGGDAQALQVVDHLLNLPA